MKNKIILGVLALAAIFSSCTKPIDPMDPVDVTKNAFLKGRYWKLTSHSHIYDTDAEVPNIVDSLNKYPDCRKDDYLDIKTTSQGFINNYFIKCLDIEPQEVEIFYTITENDSYIKVFTDPTNIDGTLRFQGQITTPTINKFLITQSFWNESKERNERSIYTFESFTPDF